MVLFKASEEVTTGPTAVVLPLFKCGCELIAYGFARPDHEQSQVLVGQYTGRFASVFDVHSLGSRVVPTHYFTMDKVF